MSFAAPFFAAASQALPYISAATSVIGAVRGSNAYKDYGNSQIQEANFRSLQLDREAKRAQAESQRDAIEARRKTAIQLSRAQALAAASGAGALDPSVLNLMIGITGEGEMAANNALYEGNERASNLRFQGDVSRYQGYLADKAARTSAKNTLFSGIATAGLNLAGTLASNYGYDNPSAPTPEPGFTGGFSTQKTKFG